MRVSGMLGQRESWGGAALRVLLCVWALAGVAQAAPRDAREMAAREAFAAGRYQAALDLYIKLYAEKLHPNYLRNIGRCYQNLGDPDHAISSFREYLRKARGMTADERTEIEGYIDEMEALKHSRAEAEKSKEAPPAPVVLAAPAPPPPPLVVASPPPPEPTPVYHRWWFWTAVGVAVVGGAVAVAASGALSGSKDPACVGRTCQ